jgi:hypothetical protein
VCLDDCFLLRHGPVWPALLSMAGSATFFALGWVVASVPPSPNGVGNEGLGSLILLAWFGILGIIAVAFSVVQFVDAKHPVIWGAIILGGYGLTGFIVALLVVIPFFSSTATPNLAVLIVSVVGPILGATGGIWGMVWKRSSTPKFAAATGSAM